MRIITSQPRPGEKADAGVLVIFEKDEERPVNGRLRDDGFVYLWLREEKGETLYRRIPDLETLFGLELTLSAPLLYDLRIKGTEEHKLADIMGRIRKQWLTALDAELKRNEEGHVEADSPRRAVVPGAPDGEWWFDITVDRDCFELHAPPMTLARARKLEKLIQRLVFDFAAGQRFSVRLDLPPRVDPWCRGQVKDDTGYTATYHGYQYGFCSQKCLNAFAADPAAAFQEHMVDGSRETDARDHLHPADPVCGTCVIDLNACPHTVRHLNQTFFFCSAGCKADFERDPAKMLNRQVILAPHRVEGAGHIHIDLESGFHQNHRHLVNFITEINNLGLWPFTDFRVLEHEARPLSIQQRAREAYVNYLKGPRSAPTNFKAYLKTLEPKLVAAQRDVVAAILTIEFMVYGHPITITAKGELQSDLNDDNAKYQTVCLRRYRANERMSNATVEIRAFRPQASTAEIIQILDLLNRLLRATETDRLIPYNPIAFTRPKKAGSEALEDHYAFAGPPLATAAGRILDLFERLSLDVLDFRALFPAVLQAEVLDQYQVRQHLATTQK